MKFLVLLSIVAALATYGHGQSYYYSSGGQRLSGLSGLSGGYYGLGSGYYGLGGGSYRLVSGGHSGGNLLSVGGLRGYSLGYGAAAPAYGGAYYVQGAAAPAYTTVAAAPAVQTVAYRAAAAPAFAYRAAAAPAYTAVAAAPAAASGVTLSTVAANLASSAAPVHAAITTTRSLDVVEGPSSEGAGEAQSVVIGPNTQPLNLEFHSQASPLSVNQIHHPTPAAAPQEASYQEDADHLRQNIVKPVVQEVHETIQPVRQVTQELKPVEEHVHQVLARGQERTLYSSGAASGSFTGAPIAASASLGSATGYTLRAAAAPVAVAAAAPAVQTVALRAAAAPVAVAAAPAVQTVALRAAAAPAYTAVAAAPAYTTVAAAPAASYTLVGHRAAAVPVATQLVSGSGLRAGGANYRVVGSGLQNLGGLQSGGAYSYRTSYSSSSGSQ